MVPHLIPPYNLELGYCFYLFLRNGHYECTDALLQAGAVVNKQDVYGCGTLTWAAWHGHPGCVDLLITTADINAQDTDGRTALMWTADYSSPECVDFLLPAGAGGNRQDACNKTSVMWAARSEEYKCVLELLLAGAKINYADDDHYNALELCLSCNDAVNVKELN